VSGFLLDTNVPSELTRIKPDPRVARWLENADDDELHLSVISIGEFCKGFTVHPEEHRRASLREWLDSTLRPWFAGRILPVSEAISERWGILEGECQLKGLTLDAPDGIIAATALEHDLTIVTRNVKDFAGLGVTIFNPWDAV
jgi:toxin FitB